MSKVVRKKKMMILWIIIAVILLVTLWFNIPYSPFKNQFRKDVAKRSSLSEQSDVVGSQHSGSGMSGLYRSGQNDAFSSFLCCMEK